MDQLYYELIHNLVIETTRLGIDVKNLKMRVESLTSRLEFNERRARALESVVVYKPIEETEAPAQPQADSTLTRFPQSSQPPPRQATPEGPGQQSRRRRRRRGRRGGGGSAAAVMGPSSALREPQGRPEGRAAMGSSQTTEEPASAPSETVTTVEQALAPEAQPSEPHVEGSTGNEPDSQ